MDLAFLVRSDRSDAGLITEVPMEVMGKRWMFFGMNWDKMSLGNTRNTEAAGVGYSSWAQLKTIPEEQ